MYCGMREEAMLVETIQESVRLVHKHYSTLGVVEIREAFSMAAANHFDGVNMTAYFGTFTVSMLGDILSAYIKFRNPIIAEAWKIVTEEVLKSKEASEKDQKNQEARQKIFDQIELAIIAVQSGEDPVWETWHDVPVHFAEIAVEQGWIEVSSEFKKQVWERSKQLALNEISSAANDVSNFSEAKKARLKMREIIETNAVPEPAKRIYSKLLIFEYVQIHKI